MRKKVVLTGGHAATTALATIQKLLESNKEIDWDITWIGAREAFEGKKIAPSDFKIFSKRDIKYVPLVSGRIQRRFSRWTIFSILKIPLSFIHSFSVLVRIRPNVIVSFGGFVSFPVVVNGWIMRIPIIIHEQTMTAGLANKITSVFADKIALSRLESKKYFPKKKVVITGNPVLKEICGIKSKKASKSKTIFVTGGSRGSRFINELIADSLKLLLNNYRVLHQTGELDYKKLRKLSKFYGRGYEVYSYIDPSKMWKFYTKADVIIARSGANNVSEIMIAKRPSILIPIPWTYNNEQQKNAEYAKEYGIARILKQKDTTPNKLYKEVLSLFNDWDMIVKKVKKRKSPDRHAAKRLADIIKESVK
jgi:UDP-N-acetylglucosamine--N-acetylmuramyl-(pentapeptide) pyrophosphoryl-undecaprenol N-acetylglucosamine transferase